MVDFDELIELAEASAKRAATASVAYATKREPEASAIHAETAEKYRAITQILRDSKQAKDGVRENERLKNIGARLAGVLWDFCEMCPECGSNRGEHMPGCQKTYEHEFSGPGDFQRVFDLAFGVSD